MKRYDYRSQFKGWDKKRIEDHIEYLKVKLLESLPYSDILSDGYLKRISYLKNKLKQTS